MAFNGQAFAQSLATNPLLQLGIGMLSAPATRLPMSFGQHLGMGVRQMDVAGQLAARQRQAQMQAQMEQEKLSHAQESDKVAAAQQAAQAAYIASLPQSQQALAQADPAGFEKAADAGALRSPYAMAKNGLGRVDLTNGTFTPFTISQPGQVPIPANIPRVGQPLTASDPRVAFNFAPGTPPQVIAAAHADAQARGLLPQTPETLAAWQQTQGVGVPHATTGARLPSGFMWNPDHTQAVPIPGVPQKTNFQGTNTTPLPGDPTLSGDAYIDSIKDQGTRDLAQSYLTGDNPPPTGTALKNSAIRTAWTGALHADPTLSAGTYQVRLANRKAFTLGKQGQIVNRLNTAIGHLGDYIDQVNDLDEGSFGPTNTASNFVKGMTNNPTLGRINTIIPNLASEVAYVYNGGAPAEGEVKQREDAYSPNRGKQSDVANAVETIKLLQSKLDALQAQYQKGAGKFGAPLTMVNPAASRAETQLHALAARLGIKDVGTTVAAPPTGKTSGPTPGTVEDGYRFKGGNPADPTSWEKQ